MANCALTLEQLSRLALKASIDQGFNAAGVCKLYNCETFEPELNFVWGDRKELRTVGLNVQEYSFSYDETVDCIRERHYCTFPYRLAYEPSYDIESKFAECLRELAHA